MNKQAILDATRQDVSDSIAQPVRDVTGSPLVLAAGVGTLGAGAGMLGWNVLVNTARSLGRLPARKLFGVSNAEWNAMMDEAQDERSYRYIMPTAAGLLAAGGILALNYNPRESGNGLLSWYPSVKTAAMHKSASIKKLAEQIPMEYIGPIPKIDYNKPISLLAARDMFSNNPNLANEDYVRNFGKATTMATLNQTGCLNPMPGQFESVAQDKFMNKFTLEGITDIGVKTALANTAARMLTGVVGAVSPLPQDVRETLIDGTTLATALISIIK